MKGFLRVLFLLLITMSETFASPGAYGPNVEHLDVPGGHVHANAAPRVEAFTDSFELLGHLQGNELLILVDRYETNEPVLNAKMDVSFNGSTASAKFDMDQGDYVVNDPQFIKAISAAGRHSLIFTLVVGDESDLFEGTLEVGSADADRGHSRDDRGKRTFSLATWGAAAVLPAIALIGLTINLSRRKPPAEK
jgi:hypothetical protein